MPNPFNKGWAFVVPLAGLEPARYFYRGILSPLRLPIPPQRQIVFLKENSALIRAEFFGGATRI